MAQDHNQSSALVLQKQGAALAEAGSFDEAVACFQASLEQHWNEPATHEMLAQVLIELEKHEEAQGAATTAVELDPQWADARVTLARAYFNCGHVKASLKEYQQAMRLDPSIEPDLREEVTEAESAYQQQVVGWVGLPLRLQQERDGGGGPGNVLWDCGIVLANHLRVEHAGDLAGAHVLELGSGTGIGGLAAALLGANAVLTDLPHSLPLLTTNIEGHQSAVAAAGGSARAAALDWRTAVEQQGWLGGWHSALGREYDLILGADLVYSLQQVDPFTRLLPQLLTLYPRASLLLAHKHRHQDVDDALVAALADEGLVVEALPRQPEPWLEDPQFKAVALYRLTISSPAAEPSRPPSPSPAPSEDQDYLEEGGDDADGQQPGDPGGAAGDQQHGSLGGDGDQQQPGHAAGAEQQQQQQQQQQQGESDGQDSADTYGSEHRNGSSFGGHGIYGVEDSRAGDASAGFAAAPYSDHAHPSSSSSSSNLGPSDADPEDPQDDLSSSSSSSSSSNDGHGDDASEPLPQMATAIASLAATSGSLATVPAVAPEPRRSHIDLTGGTASALSGGTSASAIWGDAAAVLHATLEGSSQSGDAQQHGQQQQHVELTFDAEESSRAHVSVPGPEDDHAAPHAVPAQQPEAGSSNDDGGSSGAAAATAGSSAATLARRAHGAGATQRQQQQQQQHHSHQQPRLHQRHAGAKRGLRIASPAGQSLNRQPLQNEQYVAVLRWWRAVEGGTGSSDDVDPEALAEDPADAHQSMHHTGGCMQHGAAGAGQLSGGPPHGWACSSCCCYHEMEGDCWLPLPLRLHESFMPRYGRRPGSAAFYSGAAAAAARAGPAPPDASGAAVAPAVAAEVGSPLQALTPVRSVPRRDGITPSPHGTLSASAPSKSTALGSAAAASGGHPSAAASSPAAAHARLGTLPQQATCSPWLVPEHLMYVPRKVVLLACGPPGVGKTAVLRELCGRIANCVYLDADTLLASHWPVTGQAGDGCCEPSHAAHGLMFALARDNLAARMHCVVIMDGQFGDKLDCPHVQAGLEQLRPLLEPSPAAAAAAATSPAAGGPVAPKAAPLPCYEAAAAAGAAGTSPTATALAGTMAASPAAAAAATTVLHARSPLPAAAGQLPTSPTSALTSALRQAAAAGLQLPAAAGEAGLAAAATPPAPSTPPSSPRRHQSRPMHLLPEQQEQQQQDGSLLLGHRHRRQSQRQQQHGHDQQQQQQQHDHTLSFANCQQGQGQDYQERNDYSKPQHQWHTQVAPHHGHPYQQLPQQHQPRHSNHGAQQLAAGNLQLLVWFERPSQQQGRPYLHQGQAPQGSPGSRSAAPDGSYASTATPAAAADYAQAAPHATAGNNNGGGGIGTGCNCGGKAMQSDDACRTSGSSTDDAGTWGEARHYCNFHQQHKHHHYHRHHHSLQCMRLDAEQPVEFNVQRLLARLLQA